jgi:hypothetical protein
LRRWDSVDRPAWPDRSVAPPPLRCARRPVPVATSEGSHGHGGLGIDAHKRNHTVVAQCQHGVGPAGSLHHFLPLAGLVPFCGRWDSVDRPAWPDRSVAPPPLRCARRPVPVAHE